MFDAYGFGNRVKLLGGGGNLWEARQLLFDRQTASFPAPTIGLTDRDTALVLASGTCSPSLRASR